MYWLAAWRNPMLGLALAAVTACMSAGAGAADNSQLAAQSPAPAAVGSQSTATQSGDTGDQLQEVVVTAERRAERLQDVPASVEVFTQQKLESQSVGAMDDLTPNPLEVILEPATPEPSAPATATSMPMPAPPQQAPAPASPAIVPSAAKP